METKSCFICCVLMILVISSVNAQSAPESSFNERQLVRGERGAISNALKGAVVGGIASKLTGHSALKGAGIGAAGGVVAGKLLGRKHNNNKILLSGAPGSKPYDSKQIQIDGHRLEECDPAGCMFELVVQLIVIMCGKQFYNSFLEMAWPICIGWFRRYHIRLPESKKEQLKRERIQKQHD